MKTIQRCDKGYITGIPEILSGRKDQRKLTYEESHALGEVVCWGIIL